MGKRHPRDPRCDLPALRRQAWYRRPRAWLHHGSRADWTAPDRARHCAELSPEQVRSNLTARAFAGTSSFTRTQIGHESEIRPAAPTTSPWP